MTRDQCDQIGRFLKVFVNKFANKKGAQKIGDFSAKLKNINLCKNDLYIIVAQLFLKQLGDFFPYTSGHTSRNGISETTVKIDLTLLIIQCDQIGIFFKRLAGDKISYKSSPNIWLAAFGATLKNVPF